MTPTPPTPKQDPFIASLMLSVAVILGSTGVFLLAWVAFQFRARSLDPDYWSRSATFVVIALAAFASMVWLGAKYQDKEEPISRGPRPATWFFPVLLAFLAPLTLGAGWTVFRHSWEVAGFPTTALFSTLLAGWLLLQVYREASRYVDQSVRPQFGEGGEWSQLVVCAIAGFGWEIRIPGWTWAWIGGGTGILWTLLAIHFYRHRLPAPPHRVGSEARGPGLPD